MLQSNFLIEGSFDKRGKVKAAHPFFASNFPLISRSATEPLRSKQTGESVALYRTVITYNNDTNPHGNTESCQEI